MQNGMILIKQINTKGNTTRGIPTNNVLYRTLLSIPRHIKSDYVFCDGKGARYDNIRKSFVSACKRANIHDFTFHDLRHTSASIMVSNGVPLKVIQEILGHKSIHMTMRYSHLAPDNLKDAVKVLEEKFGSPQFRHNLRIP